MLGLDLSFAQKLEVGFIAVVLGIAGFLIVRYSRPTVDTTVTCWIDPRPVGLDPRQPVSSRNPADPAKARSAHVFAFHDGHLEIVECVDENIKPTIAFYPDQKRQSYVRYEDPWSRVSDISDPYKRTLSIAAYSAAEGKTLGLLGKTGLNDEQLKAEKELRQKMLEKVDDIQSNAKSGLFLPEMYDNILRALAAYKAREGDPSRDSAKAALAYKVIDLSLKYLEKQKEDEAAAIEKYISGVDEFLTKDQKSKLADAGKAVKLNTIPKVNPNNTPKSKRVRASG